MTKYNPYARALKNCGDRLKEDDSGAKVILKQHDPKRMLGGTYNKPTSDEVAIIMCAPDLTEPTKHIERDVMVHTYGNDLI